MGGIGYGILVLCLILFAMPAWIPVVMLAYHGFTAKSFWQFSLRFLLALLFAECVSLAISVAILRWLNSPPDWPVPG